MPRAPVIMSYVMFYDHAYMGESPSLQQFLRPGLCSQSLKHSARVSPLDKGGGKKNEHQ